MLSPKPAGELRVPRQSLLSLLGGDLINAGMPSWNLAKRNPLFTIGEVEEIKKIPVTRRKPDELVWHFDRRWIFSVKSCNYLLKGRLEQERGGANRAQDMNSENELWKQIWKLRVPHKLKHFL